MDEVREKCTEEPIRDDAVPIAAGTSVQASRPFDKPAKALHFIIGYLVVASLLAPFGGSFWIDEVPVLGLLQMPKIIVSDSLRSHLVVPAIQALGFSKGSYSPDYAMAGPYSLALAWLIPVSIILAVTWRTTRMAPPFKRLSLIFFVVAVVDLGVSAICFRGTFL